MRTRHMGFHIVRKLLHNRHQSGETTYKVKKVLHTFSLRANVQYLRKSKTIKGKNKPKSR